MVNGSPLVEADGNRNHPNVQEHTNHLEDGTIEAPSAVQIHETQSTPPLSSKQNSEPKKTLFCSLPLDKVQTILSKYSGKMKSSRKVLCLYCDRTFVNSNLKQKHVERCHSSKQLRRVSLRKHQNVVSSTPCFYCDKFNSTDRGLKDLLKHLIENHTDKYFGCLTCEVRFLSSAHLADHNALCHNFVNGHKEEVKTRKKHKVKKEEVVETVEEESRVTRNLRSKKLAVKTSRMLLKRGKRLQSQVAETCKKKRNRTLEKRKEQSFDKGKNLVNPYPEFDHFFQVKKITDHSIDNLKISSLTFDDVFDKAFFNRIKCNIQENLLHHIDGKLFKNEESESRISNFEKCSNVTQEVQNLNTENYGCELSLNAVAPTSLLLCNQLGDDPESQIEYGSKPSKKKTQMKKDEVHYKYFTRRKYQASILEHKENRDLSKLDMWTQFVIKNRQQKILDDKKTPQEILDYFAGEEYKNTMRREELNRILDRRGPFEDLKEEVSKKAALDKLNGDYCQSDDDSIVIKDLLNDMLNSVFDMAVESPRPQTSTQLENQEIPSYLNLRPSTSSDAEIDRSDRIALICSSQETENFEHPSNPVRGKNEKVELTGEWARSRIYVCAACGLKLQNIKQFLEHKSANHQYIWVQHYEFVGNQSELYRHLSIPVLGKVGVLEETAQCKVWKRSEARVCTKCGKQCNSLGELHRHILECGGDWTWMLARKKCKYRPFGAKSRRKRRGLVKRIYHQKTEPSEKKVVYKKPFQKPSDADTIKRMLANLPPKRITRKVVDSFVPTRTKPKFKCGKLIRGTKSNEQNDKTRRSLRSLNKVLTSRILDKNPLIVKRKCNRKINKKEESPPKEKEEKTAAKPEEVKEVKPKRTSPRIEKIPVEEKLGIKRFFPVRKKKQNSEITISEDTTSVTANPRKRKCDKRIEVNFKRTKVKKCLKKTKEQVEVQSEVCEKPDSEQSVNEVKSVVEENVETVEEVEPVSDVKIEEPKNGTLTVPTSNKKKLRRPLRGLNDCIAMLTNKLHKDLEVSTTKKNVEEETSIVEEVKIEETAENVVEQINVLEDIVEPTTLIEKTEPEKVVEEKIEKIEEKYILKIPFSNEHFHLRSEKVSECLEVCTETAAITLNEEEKLTTDEKEKLTIKENQEPVIEEKEETEEVEVKLDIQQIEELAEPPLIDDGEEKEKVETDSEDELPLLFLLKEDQEKTNDEETKTESEEALVEAELESKASDEVRDEEKAQIDALKKKDATVLTEISDNFEYLENPAPSDANKILPETKFDDQIDLVHKDSCDMLSLSSKETDSLVALEQQNFIRKLEKINLFSKNCVNEVSNEERVEGDTSEYKENSLVVVDDLNKTKKEKKKQNSKTRSKEGPRLNGTKKTIKSKIFDCVFDESLPESEEEDKISKVETVINEEESTDKKELRRSSRNSKRIVYNETDLVDPLLDDIDSKTVSKIIKETTRDLFGLKKKKKKVPKTDKKLNGEELFDLLKSTPDENVMPLKPSLVNSFDEVSTDFNDDNFDIFEDILEKSMAVIEENLSEPVFSPSPKIDEEVEEKKKAKSKKKKKQNSIETDTSVSNLDLSSSMDTSQEQKVKKNIYCEICDKSFCRVEGLTKHKRTLTHISKLSELEAKEAALKAKDEDKSLSLLDMLDSVEEPKEYSNSNIKLADIINDVLNKPMLEKSGCDFSEQPEIRRYKSLGERKSFESDCCETKSAGTILEKQISLLENIIESRSGLNYMDELSSVSSASINSFAKKTEVKDAFLKPNDEVSEDSILKNSEEHKQRKVLNRDEELFLECCSLLKSGSEVSNHASKDVNKSKETWLENDKQDLDDSCSDTSIRTPLGDSFLQEDSDSVTQWKKNGDLSLKNDDLKFINEDLNFDKVFNGKECDQEGIPTTPTFDGVITDTLDCEKNSFKRTVSNSEDSNDGKKLLTKGAMKVFEGLKVSIPTEELNMSKIFEPKPKPSRPKRRKTNKDSKMNSKIVDVYDFEETQDNSDVFMRPDFRTFRQNKRQDPKQDGSGDESQEDGVSFDALSCSTSSAEAVPANKQNITKKKCMIMGRIFKNAAKSKTADEDIRSIPVLDNTKLVQDFVMNLEPMGEEKRRMTEEEMNLAFDKLINKAEEKNKNRKRQKTKTKKKSCASDSSDDEFKVQRYKKKKVNEEESCINLEQELRECIGVASRKSQRKCTSGKQNVLIEYWSSDESSVETVVVEKVPKKVEVLKMPERVLEIDESSQAANRRKRLAANPLYHWSSSSEDESRDLIEVKPIRDEFEDDEDRPVQHGWIVGDSPKKLVTMLAQAKGKKCEVDGVKEDGKKRTYS